MPSETVITISLKKYHRDFLVTLFGQQPFEFPRRHILNRMLNMFVDNKEPAYCALPHTDSVRVQIKLPFFDDKDTRCYFFLSPVQESLIAEKVNDLFVLTFRDEIDKALIAGMKKHNAIKYFIDKYNIDPSTIDMLVKDYHRYRTLKRVRKHKNIKKNISVKAGFCPAVNVY